MAITRSQVESILVDMRGGWMEIAEYSLVHDGTNSDLATVISQSLLHMGIGVTDVLNPTDADIAGMPDSELDKLLMWADMTLLYALLAKVPAGNISIAGLSVDVSLNIRQAIHMVELQQKRVYTYAANRMRLGYSASYDLYDEFSVPEAS